MKSFLCPGTQLEPTYTTAPVTEMMENIYGMYERFESGDFSKVDKDFRDHTETHQNSQRPPDFRRSTHRVFLLTD